MFKLWQHKNGVWYVLYGPRLKRRISTGSRDRAKAQTYLSQFIAGFQEPAIESPTVEQILTGYRDDHGKTLRGQDGLRYAVKALVKDLGDLKPEHLTPSVIKRYAVGRAASNGTVLREIGVLRAGMGWALAHKLIAVRPQISDPVKRANPRDRWLTKPEARKLIAACVSPHTRLFVILGLATCARTSAILEAKWNQINGNVIDMGHGHGNKHRATIPLNKEAMSALKAAKRLACTEYLVEYHGRRVTSIRRAFDAACVRAGLEDVTPHILRHTGATWMVLAGVPLAEVARMLGDSERTTERVYAKHTPGFLKRAATALQVGR